MSRAMRWTLSILLLGATGLALLIGAALVWGVPYDQVSLVIDGQPIDIPALTAGHWLVASAVVLVVLVGLMLVVPLVVACALAVPALLFAGALALGTLGAVLALSPALLAAWLGWWLWQRSRKPDPVAAPPAPPPGS